MFSKKYDKLETYFFSSDPCIPIDHISILSDRYHQSSFFLQKEKKKNEDDKTAVFCHFSLLMLLYIYTYMFRQKQKKILTEVYTDRGDVTSENVILEGIVKH